MFLIFSLLSFFQIKVKIQFQTTLGRCSDTTAVMSVQPFPWMPLISTSAVLLPTLSVLSHHSNLRCTQRVPARSHQRLPRSQKPCESIFGRITKGKNPQRIIIKDSFGTRKKTRTYVVSCKEQSKPHHLLWMYPEHVILYTNMCLSCSFSRR